MTGNVHTPGSGQLTRPAVLLLSHCVPEANGSASRARAWQLLKLLGLRYVVYLGAVYDGPVNLRMWRAVDRCASGFGIGRSRTFRRTAAQLMRIGRDKALETAFRGSLTDPVERWCSCIHFNAVACTHPALLGEVPVAVGLPTICYLMDRSNPQDEFRLAGICLIVESAAQMSALQRHGHHVLLLPRDAESQLMIPTRSESEPRDRLDPSDTSPLARAA